jgi:outer membrane protein TolC
VENDLVAADIYQKEFDIRTKNSAAADLTEQLTLNQYKAGTVDFTTVVVEQTAALNSRLQLAQMRISRQTNAVTLITDLGGGWKTPDYSHYE